MNTILTSALPQRSRSHPGAKSDHTDTATNSPPAPPTKADRPASVVSLSPQAKAILAQESNLGQELINLLNTAANFSKKNKAPLVTAKQEQTSAITQTPPQSTGAATQTEADTDKAVTDKNPQTQADQSSKWSGVAPYGNPNIPEEDFQKIVNSIIGIKRELMSKDPKTPPNQLTAIDNALKNGTIKYENACNVTDLHLTMVQRFTPSAIGGGYDCFGSMEIHPTGAVKEAWEQGRAMYAWTQDRGAIYISW